MVAKTIIPFCIALGICAVLTPLVRRLALAKGWMARPSRDRWHKKPTALMGGIAIFASIAAVLLAYVDLPSVWQSITTPANNIRFSILSGTIFIGAAFLFALGLFDDFRNIKPHTKLIGQILAAALVAFLGFRLHWFTSLTVDTMATLFWIVGLSNAFNLIDNMDGLCAGVGMVASLALAVLFYPAVPEAVAVALTFAGALGGFLIYNFNPAKIFMGDCGSLVIGFGVSVLSLGYSELSVNNNKVALIAVPVLIMLVPILDTTLVTVIRILSGRKASTGGRDHTSHRLVLMGFTEKNAVLFLYGVSGLAGVSAVYVSRSDTMTSPAVIIPMVLAIILMGVYLSQLRVYPDKEFSVLRDRSFTPVLIELTYKRHMILVGLDFVLVAFAYYLAYRLRFEGQEFAHYFKVFLKSLPIIIGCKLVVFYLMGIYRGIWSFISTNDVFLYVKASLAATLASVVGVTFIYRFKDFSKGVFLIDFIFTTALMLGARGSFRLFLETQKRQTLEGDSVAIYGAGRGGELLLREILNNKQLHVRPVGFMDDDPLKVGKKIQGYEILGGLADIHTIHQNHHLDGILISFNEVNGRHSGNHEAVRRFCREKGLFLKRFKVNLIPVDVDAAEPIEKTHEEI
jgi:UDP-GlcNAc:undecaprenyl-phosphate GlcNAc-1-phosphate transferase